MAGLHSGLVWEPFPSFSKNEGKTNIIAPIYRKYIEMISLVKQNLAVNFDSPWQLQYGREKLISVYVSFLAVHKGTNSTGKNELFQTDQDTKGVGSVQSWRGASKEAQANGTCDLTGAGSVRGVSCFECTCSEPKRTGLLRRPARSGCEPEDRQKSLPRIMSRQALGESG
jgi:hypothetical protein